MQPKIHPNYNSNLVVTCACGASFITGSTKKEITTEICSACHPFYTGQTKLVDTAGRVDKFMAKIKKASAIKEEKATKKAQPKAKVELKAPKKATAKKSTTKKK